MKYLQSLDEIKNADRLQICKWYRFLPIARNDRQSLIINQIHNRFNELGGITAEISKAIGWKK